MRIGLCIEMAFADLPLEDRVRKAADCGFRNVEMWLVDGSFRGRPEQLANIAQTHDITITNTVIGSPDGAIGGGLTSPAKRQKWLARAAMPIKNPYGLLSPILSCCFSRSRGLIVAS